MPRPRLPARPRRAFTFVELLLVVMLLGVMAGVAAPRYDAALAETHRNAAARRLAADLRSARAAAIATASSVAVVFDPDSGAYGCAGLSDPDHPNQRLEVSLAASRHGLTLAAADFGGSATVAFDFRGDASAAGEVTLTSNGRSTVVAVDELGGVEVR